MSSAAVDGYMLRELLYRSHSTVIHRATRLHDGLRVVLKVLSREHPDAQEVARFQHEFQLTQALQLPGVIRAHGLERIDGRYAMVLEDFAGPDLAAHLERRQRLPPGEVLDIAVALAEALGQVHRAQIIHKQICPANTLFDSATGMLKLIDFGVATELSSECQDFRAGGVLEGSLPYLSPEQSGRMNREVDYRSDYYSLGVMLHQLLTGALPFHAEDTLGWIHCHIARTPTDPHRINPKVPEPLAQIVLKLMAKDADARYQSARGLIHDLERCRDGWTRHGQVERFTLATADVPERFRIPQRLYGRERECHALLHSFEEVARGKGDWLLVAGAAGIGKSALVSEVRKPILERRGYFTQGKFEQFQRDVPYFAVAQAFRGWVRELLGESPDRLAYWLRTLTAALAPNARMLVDIVPELERVIGPQPAVQDSDPREARNRFLITFRALIAAIARAEHPLVLFLDDLQWSDTPTIELLSSLLSGADLPYFLLIGAYRSEEVHAGHPLMLAVDAVRAQRRVVTLELAPLDLDTVNRVIAETLHLNPTQTLPLAELVHRKTDGNPYFVNEVLKKLHQDEALRFDHEAGRWVWDWERARAASVSDNVVAFMVGRLRQLAEDTRDALLLASCVGNEFDLGTLAVVSAEAPARTARCLWQAVQEGMLVPLNEDYLWAQAQDDASSAEAFNASYRFQHDRVQQAAYSLLAEARRRATHLQIARMMLRHAGGTAPDERVIEIARHYNEGLTLVESPQERALVARLNLAAGRKAKASSAYEPALRYLRAGLDLLGDQPWATRYEVAFALHREAAECAYLCGDYPLAEDLAAVLLAEARTPLEQAEIYHMRVRQYVVQGQMHESIAAGIDGLALLGFRLAAKPGVFAVLAEALRTRRLLRGRPIAALIDLPAMTSPEILLANKLLMELGPPAYLLGNDNLLAVAAIKQVNLSLAHGNSPASAFAYTFYAMIVGAVFGDLSAAAQFGRLGVDLNDRLGDLGLRCRICFMYAFFTQHWNEPWSRLESHYKRSIEAGYQSGDLFYLAYSAVWLPQHESQVDLSRAIETGHNSLQIVETTHFEDARDIAVLCQQQRLALRGSTHSATAFDDSGYDEQAVLRRMQERSFRSGVSVQRILKLELAVHHGDVDLALALIAEIERERLLKAMVGSFLIYEFQLYALLAWAMDYRRQHGWRRLRLRLKMHGALSRMRRWARHCPGNFAHAELLMRGELVALSGPPERALRHFDEAMRAARAIGYARYEALAAERAAECARAHGRERVSQDYAADAYQAYRRWGAEAVAGRVQRRFALAFAPASATAGTSPQEPSAVDLAALDLASVFKAARSISGEIELERLLASLTGVVQENAAARRVVLLLRDDSGQWLIQAEIDGDSAPVVMQSLPMDESLRLPTSVVNYVIRTLEPVVLGDAVHDDTFGKDPYIGERASRSLLCIPALNQGQLVAVLLLENDIVAHAFTPERVAVLDVLAAQAAISIANARLYAQVTALNRAYQRFVPRQFLSLLGKHSILEVELGDHLQAELSILFSDIRAFTALSERLTPQENFNYLNSYLSRMEPLIGEHRGFIDKYIGDAIMALFPRSADDALAAAIAMLQQLAQYNLGRQRAGYASIGIGIGINTGALTLGVIGGGEHIEGTVIGDSVNLAARISGMNKHYGTPLLISEHTLSRLREPQRHCLRFVDRVRVQGKARPVSVFEVMDADPVERRERKLETAQWLEPALGFYQAGRFGEALELFRRCIAHDSADRLAHVYAERCQRYHNHGPAGPWDGVVQLDYK